MKVLHVITGLSTGGAETVLARLLEHLADRAIGHNVICLGPDGPVGDKLRTLNINVMVLGGRGRVAGPRLMHQTRAIARKLMPEVILGWMYDANLAAWWAARDCGASLVWNIRYSIAELDREPIGLRLVIRANGWFSRSPKVIVFNSRTSANQHAALGFPADAMRVIPNGFDTDTFIPSAANRRRIRSELNVPDDAFLIGKIARFHPMKDHSGFLFAARLVAEQIPEVHFLLAGSGVDHMNESLLRTVEEYGIRDRVRLLGERHDVPALNAALDTAVSASAWGEGFPNVIGEALSCGIPVVATDVGDSRLIVGDAGYVVPPGDPEALAERLVTLYHAGGDRRRSLGELGREHVKRHYSIEKMVEQYAAVWRGTALCEKLE